MTKIEPRELNEIKGCGNHCNYIPVTETPEYSNQ